MTVPPDGGPGTAITDADRDAIADVLARHHAEGRLTVEQLEQRVAVVYGAGTREQAAAAIADLPALVPSGPSRGPGLLRRRRHGESTLPGAGWMPTQERFRDPKSKQVMRVWVDPATGERHYVPD